MLQARMPELPLEGGCQCGRVRYRRDGPCLSSSISATAANVSATHRARSANRCAYASVDLEVEGEMKCVASALGCRQSTRGLVLSRMRGVRIVHGTKGAEMVKYQGRHARMTRPGWCRPAISWVRSKQRFFDIGAEELCYDTAPR